MSIKCKIGDVVRVYRHHLKDCIGIVGMVGYVGEEAIRINILGKGAFLFEKTYLAHVKKETTVIVGVHDRDAFYEYRNELIGKYGEIIQKAHSQREGYFTGTINVPTRGDWNLYFHAVKLHTYNKGKK